MTGSVPRMPAAPPSTPTVRSLGLRTDLAVLLRGGSEVEDRGTHLVVRTPHNPDFWWGNFLLLRDLPVPGGEREVVGACWTEFPDAAHVAIALDGVGTVDAAALERFAAAGLTIEADAVLTAERLVAPVHAVEDVGVRPLSGDDWEQWVELESVVTTDGPEDAARRFIERRVATERAACERGDAVRVGAFADGVLVSTAAVHRVGDDTARFQVVETHPDHRRRGLAGAVVHAAGSAALADLGVRRLVIVADPDGPAIGIYRRLGFTDAERVTQLSRAPQPRG